MSSGSIVFDERLELLLSSEHTSRLVIISIISDSDFKLPITQISSGNLRQAVRPDLRVECHHYGCRS